jgi:hypothetical protein
VSKYAKIVVEQYSDQLTEALTALYEQRSYSASLSPDLELTTRFISWPQDPTKGLWQTILDYRKENDVWCRGFVLATYQEPHQPSAHYSGYGVDCVNPFVSRIGRHLKKSMQWFELKKPQTFEGYRPEFADIEEERKVARDKRDK